VFIHHDNRFVRIARITSNPLTSKVTQQTRNLSTELAAQTNPVKFLTRDRDTKFTASVDAVIAADGTRIIKTPIHAPQTNAICERLIGTIRRKCLDRILILSRRHLEAVLAQYVKHYNTQGPHRSLSQQSPSTLHTAPALVGDVDAATLRKTDRQGGLIHEYRIAARARRTGLSAPTGRHWAGPSNHSARDERTARVKGSGRGVASTGCMADNLQGEQ
jgi:hypothetical protein